VFGTTDDTTTQVLDPETRRFGWLLHCAGLIVVLLCGAFYYSWIFEEAKDSIVKLSADIEELKLSVQNAPVVRRTHDELSQRLDGLKSRMAELGQRVPPTADAGKFLGEVSRIAREETLAISEIQPDKPMVKDGFTEMEVKLTAEGDFKSICSFFDRLNKLSRLSKVKSLAVSTPSTTEKLPMTATIVIYFGLRGSGNAAPEEVQRG
jgi:Tfp pilus assembly protein PilO